MGKASLILGVIAILISFIPVFGLPGTLVLGLTSIGLGIGGMIKKDKKGEAMSGIIISGIAIIIAISMATLVFSVANEVTENIDEGIKKNEIEAEAEVEAEVLKSFNVDSAPQAREIVGDLGVNNWSEEFHYEPETPETCQYYITNNPTSRKDIDSIHETFGSEWVDYTEAVTLTSITATHIIARNCGEWMQVSNDLR